jgi:hypothetical protein
MVIYRKSKPLAAFSSNPKAAKALGPSSKSAKPPSGAASPGLDALRVTEPWAMLGRRLPASRPEIKKTAFLLMGVFFTLIS